MQRMTIKQRTLELLANNSVPRTFKLSELRKNWRVSWHRKHGLYRSYKEYDNLFLHSFVHEGVLKLTDSKVLRRLSKGVYQVTKSGERVLNKISI